ncbi:MAG: gliding motility-associated C-terminal domain-containing protein [Bacteroidetes bacterium]|nr:gliding motility-associated C-terminal domain-containing protein [Bacteroidota bacterium]
MKSIFTILLISSAMLFSASVNAQTYLISEGGTVTTCTGTIYDSGGASGNYQNFENYTMTFCSDEPGGCLQLDFQSFIVESGFDNLLIYAGPTASGSPVDTLTGTIDPGIISTGTECITLVFTSDVSVTPAGFEIDITCVCPTCDDGIANGQEIGVDCGGPDCPECDFIVMGGNQTQVSCETTIYDNGLFGNYANSSNDILTICGENPDDCMQLEFLQFNIESGWDFMTIFDGPDTGSPIVGTYTGTEIPQFISTGSNCLTIQFTSDGIIDSPGYEIAVSCVCPTCDDGILNGQEIAADCGGPDCPECEFNVISEGGTVTGCDEQLLDAGVSGPYDNNENYTMTFCGDDPDQCLLIDFNFINIAFGVHLYVYDGTTTDGFLVADLTNTNGEDAITAPSSCVTFQFISDGFTTAGGFDLNISCDGICPTCDDGILNGYEIGVDCGGPDCEECDFIVMNGTQTENSCGTTIYDNGLFGNYANNSNDVLTICGENPEDCIQLEFLQFNIENGWDFMTIFDGPDTGSPIVGTYTGTIIPQFISTGSNCLTIQFTSDGIIDAPGYEIAVSCVCPTCDDGILNGQEVAVDCGGPDCEDCDFFVISEGGLETTCDAQLYDTGILGNYDNNENFTMTFCGENGDECLLLEGAFLDIAFGDHLYIYDGTTTDGFLIADVTGFFGSSSITTPSSCVTFQFVSDGFSTAGGFDINISCDGVCPTCDDGIQNGYEIGVDCGGPDCEECEFIVMGGSQEAQSCNTTIYDNGLFGNYDNSSNDVLTICGENPEDCVQLEFLQFDIESGWDFLSIYDGEDTNAPLLMTLTGTVAPQFVSGTGNCLTIQFTSDGIINAPGYEIAVTCQCPTCDDGIQNGQELAVDCGGPDCEECDFILISEEQTITACEGLVFDSGVNQNYMDGENYTMTICAEDTASCLLLDFASFNTEFFLDVLSIYEGTEVSGAPIQTFSGNLGAFEYTATSFCITLNFITDFSITNPGFQFSFSCVECPQPTEQDCLGANEVCDYLYIQESYPPQAGNFPVQLPPEACLDNAQNVIWYTFTVQESGNLSFVLTPDVITDDYDWGLFNLTNAACSDISTSPELLVSCNSYGSFTSNGPTGISTANGGSGNLNGPGDLNGPPFNGDYPVNAGETYALLVQNWTGSFDGYSLDFSESTAELFYPGGPEITAIAPFCNYLEIALSEPVDCATLDSADFIIQSEGQVYVVDSIASNCDLLDQTESVTIYLTPNFPDLPIEVSIQFNPDTSPVLDLCGNPVDEDTTYVFTTLQWINILTEITPTECLDEVGSIEVLATFGAEPPFIYTFQGEPYTGDLIFDGLAEGFYTIQITDQLGCQFTRESYVPTDIIEIDLVMPNVFSPNEDDVNDKFGPIAVRSDNQESLGLVDVDKFLSQYDLVIYNRWGKEVFNSRPNDLFWDGDAEGDPALEGTYFYILRYTEDCTVEEKVPRTVKGSVTVLR